MVRDKFSDAWENISAQNSDLFLQLNVYCFKIKKILQLSEMKRVWNICEDGEDDIWFFNIKLLLT